MSRKVLRFAALLRFNQKTISCGAYVKTEKTTLRMAESGFDNLQY